MLQRNSYFFVEVTMEKKIAALFVQSGGTYYGLDGVDPWDEARDARTYAGPWPVVAHPPCSRWCLLARVNEVRWGARVGDDGGCFASALEAVRRWGGVLEHPAYTLAWARYGITRPKRGVWSRSLCGGWVTEVSQVAYGHAARKRTWLYLCGVEEPPALNWAEPPHTARIGHDAKYPTHMDRLGRHAAAATPVAFRDLLVSLARSVYDCDKKSLTRLFCCATT